MSRSYKKPIFKEKGRMNRVYNRCCRRRNKQLISQGKDPLPDKAIVNQYDICDYRIGFAYCENGLFCPSPLDNIPSGEAIKTPPQIKMKRK